MNIKHKLQYILFISTTSIFIIILLAVFGSILWEAYFSKHISNEVCFSEKCFKNFYDFFETKISLIISLSKFYFAVITILGIYLAYMQFLFLINNSNLHNHLRNFEFFYNMVNKYIDTSSSIVISQVEMSFLYRKLFPQSTNGDLQLTGEFLKDHQAVRDYLIRFSKGKNKKNVKNTSDNFFQHRKEIISFGKKFGVTLPSSPKSDFYRIEDNFFDFLDYLAITFLASNNVKLLKDINLHYR